MLFFIPGLVSAMSKAREKAEVEDIIHKNRGFVSTNIYSFVKGNRSLLKYFDIIDMFI